MLTVDRVQDAVQHFYRENKTRIKESHGISHVLAVLNHVNKAIECHHHHQQAPLSAQTVMQIKLAALLHDVDDHKYFPRHNNHENARLLMEKAQVPVENVDPVLEMIDLVSCSANGNHVPENIRQTGDYYKLIPRWSDRLEAVGAVGVVRCYQFNQEHGYPLSTLRSPRAESAEQVWEFATPERFEAYRKRGGTSDDMISHYYDKLLHVACPPKDSVRNEYLEQRALESSKELVELCVRYGKTGMVDEAYIHEIERELAAAEK